MRHFALPRFWRHYQQLPKDVRKLADKNHDLLKVDPWHPSLRLKKVGKTKQLWSVRVGMHYRALERFSRICSGPNRFFDVETRRPHATCPCDTH